MFRWAFLEGKRPTKYKYLESIVKEKKLYLKNTSGAATEESSELEKSKDASVLKQCKEIHLLTHEK